MTLMAPVDFSSSYPTIQVPAPPGMDPTHDLPVPSAIMPSKTWRHELNQTKAVHGSKGVSLPAPYVPRAPTVDSDLCA
jgi:hypothetical protein